MDFSQDDCGSKWMNMDMRMGMMTGMIVISDICNLVFSVCRFGMCFCTGTHFTSTGVRNEAFQPVPPICSIQSIGLEQTILMGK